MKNRSILAACLMSAVTVPAIAADDVTVPVAVVADDITVPTVRADEERWKQPYGPSYDCETAQGVLELTVCSDPLLSRMDLEVATLHRERLKESYAGDPIGPNGRPSFEHGSGELVPSVPEPALVEATGADAYLAISPAPSRDELEEEQRRWLQARDDGCNLDLEFRAGIAARFEAVRCLIPAYARRLVELDGERRLLDALVDVGILALDTMKLDLGNVRIDLPRVAPVTRVGTAWSVASPFDDVHIDHPREAPVTSVGTPSPATAHPACIEALLVASAPSSIRRDACRAGTDHLPFALETLYEEGREYVTYVPWYPGRFGQMGDRFGYRVVGTLDDGRTLIQVLDEYTGASGTKVSTSLAVVRGLRTGETVEVEHEISAPPGADCGSGPWQSAMPGTPETNA